MPDLARAFCAQSQPCQYAANASLRLDGRGVLAPCTSPPPYRWASRGRIHATPGGRSDLRSAKDALTSQAHDIPGALQDRRGMNAASSPFRQNGVSSPAGTSGSLGVSPTDRRYSMIGWPQDPRDESRVRGPGDRQPPIIRQESEGGIRRRVRRQPCGACGRR